jgi:tetratricopeptide (TPR) repeat protein
MIRHFSSLNSKQIQILLIVLVLGLAVLITYYPAINAGYIWDDDLHVTNNTSLHSWQGLQDIWIKIGATPQYYPMVFSSFWIEYQFWELNPIGFHINNILLHLLNSLLLWRLLSFLGVRGALLASAIFALHPVHVESVAWISERKNVLSGFFYLSSILIYLRYFIFSTSPHTKKTWFFYLSSLTLFLFALLSKTVTCSLPATLLLILWWKGVKINKRVLASLVPFFLLAMVMGIITIWMEHNVVGASGNEWQFSFLERFVIAGWAVWFYIGKLIIPISLTFIYPQFAISGSVWQFYLPVSLLFLILVLWFYRKKIGKGPLVCLLFFTGTLFPALGFIDFYPMRYSFVADHFQYLASIGPITFIAVIISEVTTDNIKLFNKDVLSRISKCIISVLLILLITLSWKQAHIYENTITLWEDTIKKNSGAWIAHNNLGSEHTLLGNYDIAIYHYLQAIQLIPQNIAAYNNIGYALNKIGMYGDAIYWLKLGYDIDEEDFHSNNNLGMVYMNLEDLKQANYYYYKALEIFPNSTDTLNNIGVVQLNLGNVDKAMQYFREALRIEPDHVNANDNLRAINEK